MAERRCSSFNSMEMYAIPLRGPCRMIRVTLEWIPSTERSAIRMAAKRLNQYANGRIDGLETSSRMLTSEPMGV